MYGYSFPRKPEPGTNRVLVCESQLRHYLDRFPRLGRDRILEVLKLPRASREFVEAELRRLSEAR